jgi:hypothetical protein
MAWHGMAWRFIFIRYLVRPSVLSFILWSEAGRDEGDVSTRTVALSFIW